MTDSHSLPEANDTARQELLTHFKKLGLITDNELARMRSASTEDFQKLIDRLRDREKGYQDDFRQLITIKDVIEKHLGRLVPEVLDGRDIIESLQHAMEIYPYLRFIRWLVENVELDLGEFIKDLDVDSDYVLPILYRWKYEYKPLIAVWRELEVRRQGRKNGWNIITPYDTYCNESRKWPQLSFRLEAGTNIVWDAQEDIDDIVMLGRAFLRISLGALRELQERQDLSLNFLESLRDVISTTDEAIRELKALPILRAQKASEDSTEIP
jgi:hypothetical protein